MPCPPPNQRSTYRNNPRHAPQQTNAAWDMLCSIWGRKLNLSREDFLPEEHILKVRVRRMSLLKPRQIKYYDLLRGVKKGDAFRDWI